MPKAIMAVDQGTTSSRAILFDHSGASIASEMMEHRQIFPRSGWVEHDPMEIWANVREVMGAALAESDLSVSDIGAVGITQQRETTIVWDRFTGEPVYNAIVWQDTRTRDICDGLGALGGGDDRYRQRTGLPLATYFCGPKVRWILDNVPGAREAADAGRLLMGTIDTWLIWNMTGGPSGGLHITDVTNASRTLMMDLQTLGWDTEIAAELAIPMSMLPQIRSSSEVYGNISSPQIMEGIPLSGILGDQQGATFGQACLSPGEAKNTYGTGNFMLLNTGTKPVFSEHGLLTTVAYKIGSAPAVYALEGSVAVTGSLVQWLRDNLRIIGSADEVEALAKTVEDNGDCYFVPAFSGLFAPYWRSDARGAIVGMTRFINQGHIARAALEAAAYQSREVIDAMAADSGVPLTALKVDGGMVVNDLLMQFQSDLLGVPVIRPKTIETTALGSAYAAGLAVGFWEGEDDIRRNWSEGKRWEPRMPQADAEALFRRWREAVTRTFDWVPRSG
ncbi:MAG: glycerol kinase GlpK [Candidatus Nanopelagicales bacterium]|nr:glycerol kinase GlpK [Candidatus Nanopelagicales bacterium]